MLFNRLLAIFLTLYLKSGNSNSQLESLWNPHDVTDIRPKFYVFLPKRFEATCISLGCPSPGHGYHCPSLTQALTSQAGHIKLKYNPLYSIYNITDERIVHIYHILSLLR